MQVVLALEVAQGHGTQGAGHTHEHVGPEQGADHVEPGVSGAQQLVVWVVREALVRTQIWEGVYEGNQRVLHKAEGTEPEDCKARHCHCSPVSVQVLLKGLMENTVTTTQQRFIK